MQFVCHEDQLVDVGNLVFQSLATSMDVARASVRVFGRVVKAGDYFVTRGPNPVAVEWTAPSPGGVRLGALPTGTVFTALEIVVTYAGGGGGDGGGTWRNTFITIRCASFYMDGEDAWVNVSKGSRRYANVLTDHQPLRSRPY